MVKTNFEDPPRKQRVVISWFVEPDFVMRNLKLVPKSCEQGWSELLRWSWGVLGLDSEEGLKLRTSEGGLTYAVIWLRRFHVEHQLPYVIGRRPLIQAAYTDLGHIEQRRNVLESLGFELYPRPNVLSRAALRGGRLR